MLFCRRNQQPASQSVSRLARWIGEPSETRVASDCRSLRAPTGNTTAKARNNICKSQCHSFAIHLVHLAQGRLPLARTPSNDHHHYRAELMVVAHKLELALLTLTTPRLETRCDSLAANAAARVRRRRCALRACVFDLCLRMQASARKQRVDSLSLYLSAAQSQAARSIGRP